MCCGIYPWFEENNTCPVCRKEFPYEEEPHTSPEEQPIQEEQPVQEEQAVQEEQPVQGRTTSSGRTSSPGRTTTGSNGYQTQSIF